MSKLRELHDVKSSCHKYKYTNTRHSTAQWGILLIRCPNLVSMLQLTSDRSFVSVATPPGVASPLMCTQIISNAAGHIEFLYSLICILYTIFFLLQNFESVFELPSSVFLWFKCWTCHIFVFQMMNMRVLKSKIQTE